MTDSDIGAGMDPRLFTDYQPSSDYRLDGR
jgi:hypothetical protein